MRRFHALALLLLIPVRAAAQGQVHVVDTAGGPGADFTTILEAAGAAADGDVLLVREGNYFDQIAFLSDGVLLDGKGLVVTAEVGASVATTNLSVQNLPAASRVVVQGVEFPSSGIVLANLQGCAGPIWLERCAFAGGGFLLQDGGVVATACDGLVLVRSVLTPVLPTPSLFATSSRMHVFDTTLQGRVEGPGHEVVKLRNGSFLELLGSNVTGGDGPDGTSGSCDGGDGSDAIRLEGASELVALGSQIRGGTGGAPFGGCAPGADGRDVVVLGGSTTSFPAGFARSHEIVSPVRDDENVQAQFTGVPGDQVWMFISTSPGPGLASPRLDGELLIGAPRTRLSVGTIPASGVLQFSAPAPTLPPGVESWVFYGQAVFHDAASNRFVASSPSVLVLLDDAF